MNTCLTKEDECVLAYFFGTKLESLDSYKRLSQGYYIDY